MKIAPLILVILQVACACKYKVIEKIPSDGMVEIGMDVYNWDQSLAIFGGSLKNPLVLNYKGEICKPKGVNISNLDYGPGTGAAVSNGGILVCGGENNIWGGEDPDFQRIGGKCCLWFQEQGQCTELIPWQYETDKLGFGNSDIGDGRFNGHVILASDVNKRSRQSFIFAFAQGSSEIAHGYFLQLRKGIHGMPRIKWFWKENADKLIKDAENNLNRVPKMNPCILVDDFTVYIISGRTNEGRLLNGTWFATFDLEPNKIPIEEKAVANWTFIEGFPQFGREYHACYIDKRTSDSEIVVVGGKIGKSFSTSIERIKMNELMHGRVESTRILHTNALSASVEYPIATRLYDDSGLGKRTFVVGTKNKRIWVEKLMDSETMKFKGRNACQVGDNETSTEELSFSGTTSAIFAGILLQECQNKIKVEFKDSKSETPQPVFSYNPSNCTF